MPGVWHPYDVKPEKYLDESSAVETPQSNCDNNVFIGITIGFLIEIHPFLYILY